MTTAGLSGHTLERIEWITLKRRYPRHIGWNSQGGPHGKDQDVRACRLYTDQGATGWGFGAWPEEAAQRLVGRRLDQFFSPEAGTASEALCLDIPLHDLAGRILNQPVWRMLGARAGNKIPVYSGAIYFDDLNPNGEAPGVAALLESCRQDEAAGHAHFKLKIGRGFRYMDREAGDKRDIEVTRLVHQHFPQAKILVDGNDGYDPDGICRYLEAVADCDLYWVEEAFPETEEGLTRLRSRLRNLSPKTLIADGESRNGRLQDPLGIYGKWQEAHLGELFELGRKKLIDVLLMDVGAMGFSAWRKILPKLQVLGIQGSPHAWSEPFKTLYAAQLGCGLGGVPIVEGVPGHVDGVDDSSYKLEGGILSLPETPGFGLTLSEAKTTSA